MRGRVSAPHFSASRCPESLRTLRGQPSIWNPTQAIFSYEYDVSGTWSDPQVAKLASAKAPGAAADIVR